MRDKRDIERDPAEIFDFKEYLTFIIHDWLKTLTILGFTLIPIFFILDYFMLPIENLNRFALYRLAVTVIIFVQYLILRQTRPGKYSFLHGYFFSGIASLMISLMTVELGGFESSYYAGINLVIIATILLIPWSLYTSICNVILIISTYIVTNMLNPKPFNYSIFINNLYFMFSTGIISIAINYVQSILVEKEFMTRKQLKMTGDALMGEMEIAKKIQTRLLPMNPRIPGFEIYATMNTAAEIGGDYYDIIKTSEGVYIAIGDVSGHGVDSGLIMMMTQTSISTLINTCTSKNLSEILCKVNTILTENIWRLDIDRYMSLLLLKIDKNKITFAGKHQDLKIYRQNLHRVENFPTHGTWIGATRDVLPVFTDQTLELASGDVVLLFTDGITEAMDKTGKLYGDDRLDRIFLENIEHSAEHIVRNILNDVNRFQSKQMDDITLLACRNL